MLKEKAFPSPYSSKKNFLITHSLSTIAATILVSFSASSQQLVNDKQDEVEVIQVSGIRGSLQRSVAIKKDSKQIVDSISAEDIGQFPDTNLAESLQRISGVAIDRSGGEGKSVTVRGFGPEFNTVLLNGRRLASDTGARSFNFDVLPSELVSAVDVYKSQPANLEEGGIGSTIVMHTPRPLAFDGFKSVVSIKGQYEELSDKVSPQLFGMLSNTFADDTVGVLLSVTHQQRKNQINRLLTDGYLVLNRDEMPNISSQLAEQGYTEDEKFFLPQNLNVSPVSEDRERTTLSSTLQYRPSEDIEFTLDGLYSEFEVTSETTNVGVYFTPTLISDAQFGANNIANSVTENRNADSTRAVLNRPTKMYALGFNTDWFMSDSFNVKFDTSWSKADSGGAENTDVVVMGLGVKDQNPSTVSYDESGFPSISGINQADLIDPSLAKAHFTLRGTGGGPLGGGRDFEDEIFQQRIDTRWTPMMDNLVAVSFGMQYSKQKQSDTTRLSQPEVLCTYCGFKVDVPNELFSTTGIDADYLGGIEGLPLNWLSFDIDEAISYLESDAATTANDEANGLPAGTTAALLASTNGFGLAKRPDSTEIEENIISGYVKFELEGELANKFWNLNIGGRYVHTKTKAIGVSQILQDLVQSAADLYTPVLSGEQQVAQTNTYNYFLPNADFRINFTDNLIGRLAASKTLTRPPLGSLSPRTSIGSTRPGNLQANSGNPNLKPFIAKNVDASLEWYYQEGGYVTLGYFKKDVQNFLVSTVENRPFAIIDSENLFEGDPVFEVSLIDNIEDASVDGVEIGAQHTFSYLPGLWSGFGITANATLVDSNAELDINNTSQTFALVGLGNSYNIVGFYDYGPVEARIAWNQRDRFLQTARGFGGEPTYVTDYSQIDIRISYEITEAVQVFIEGINVANEKTKKVGRYDNQIMFYEETGPRYTLGVSASF